MRSTNYSVKQQNLLFSPDLDVAYPIIDSTQGIHFKTRKLGLNSYIKMEMPRKVTNSNLWSRQHWPVLWAQVHRAAWARAGRGPLRTPAETEQDSEHTWFKHKHFVSSASTFCKKHTRSSKYQKKNSYGLSFRAGKTSWVFLTKMQSCYTMTTPAGTVGFPFMHSLLFCSIQSQLHLKINLTEKWWDITKHD